MLASQRPKKEVILAVKPFGMVKNKTRQKPVNAWVSLCLVTKRLANWGELLRVRCAFDSRRGRRQSCWLRFFTQKIREQPFFGVLGFFFFLVQGLIFRLAFAVNAAVDAFFPVGEFEDLGQLLFGGGDAAGVGAADDAGDIFGDIQMLALDGFAVADDIDGHIRVNVADRVKIQIDDLVDFDDVLFAHFYAVRVLDDGDRTVQLRQIQDIIQRHALTGGDMVDDNAVIDGID